MPPRTDRPPVSDALRQATEENFKQISGSDAFCVLFNEAMVDEVIPLIQMGLAVYLDKPILLLVRRGANVPANLRTMAIGLEEFDDGDPASLEAASQRLFKKGHV